MILIEVVLRIHSCEQGSDVETVTDGDAFWEGLRSLATNQVEGNLAFVLAAHEPPHQLARHSNLGSPFFNVFGYTATPGSLREPEARELIAS